MLTLKSSREIAAMRNAGLIVWEAHQVAAGMIRPGITTGEIDRAVEDFFLERQVAETFKPLHGCSSGRRFGDGNLVNTDGFQELQGSLQAFRVSSCQLAGNGNIVGL